MSSVGHVNKKCIEAKVHGRTIARDVFECALADFKFACLCMLSLYLGIVSLRLCGIVGWRLCDVKSGVFV